jgi:hypothetical protein
MEGFCFRVLLCGRRLATVEILGRICRSGVGKEKGFVLGFKVVFIQCVLFQDSNGQFLAWAKLIRAGFVVWLPK